MWLDNPERNILTSLPPVTPLLITPLGRPSIRPAEHYWLLACTFRLLAETLFLLALSLSVGRWAFRLRQGYGGQVSVFFLWEHWLSSPWHGKRS